MAARNYQRLSDSYVSALWDFSRDDQAMRRIVFDSEIRGLLVRVGVHRMTFSFHREHSVRGKRSATSKTLGHWPQMSVADARKAALVEAGRIAAGHRTPGKREAEKFSTAFERYVAMLRSRGAKRGKVSRWPHNVELLGKQLLLPEFGAWSLIELSGAPKIIHDWHRDVTKDHGPTHGNHAARVLRAVYRYAARLDRSLPPGLPTSAVEWNPETGSGDRGLAFRDFQAWADAWRRIENPIHRSFHLVNLLILSSNRDLWISHPVNLPDCGVTAYGNRNGRS
jgi:hypothetical protein